MRIVRVPALGRAQYSRLVPLLAIWASLAAGIPAAAAQSSRQVWSVQLHGGLFAPFEALAASPSIGMRYGKHFSPYMQGGLLTGWATNGKKQNATTAGLGSFDAQVEVASVRAQLVPAMGFLQVNFTDRSWLVPFAGFGVGYEWLVLDVKDKQTGQNSRANYSNVAWEAYGGIGFRLSNRIRMNNELFYNGGSLERGGYDGSGREWREAVNVNGVGARVGLDMIFE